MYPVGVKAAMPPTAADQVLMTEYVSFAPLLSSSVTVVIAGMRLVMMSRAAY